MKIFVGILYSGENEFEECLASIKAQTYKNYEIHVYKHLPKFEAHSALYSEFLEKKDEYDLLIKIDADMVLISKTLFSNIVDKFNENSRMDILEIAIIDFFSGGLIHGLNSYRNKVSWVLDPQNVNADKVIVDKNRHVFDDSDLAPAAIHCKNPSRLQSFHFGLHRGVKIFAPQHSTTHWALLEKTWKNFLDNGDVRIGLAVLGAELVFAGKFTKDDIDYTNPKVLDALKEFEDMDAIAIRREIMKLRLLHWGFLPSDLRRRVLRSKYKSW